MIQVPFIDVLAGINSVRPLLDAAINDVLAAGSLILGPRVAAFEEAFASYVGGTHAVGVGSGTAAIELALRATGVGPGDEVITASNSFIATALAVRAVGAEPVFVDVDPATANIDATLVETAVTAKTAALLPVHLYGRVCDVYALRATAQRHGLRLIEDACQAHGAVVAGSAAGSIGDAGCFSFYPTKNLGALGDAGIVVTSDDEVAAQLRLLRNYGQVRKYEHSVAGTNNRLDEIQAAALLTKLPNLDAANAERRAAAVRYAAELDPSVVTMLGHDESPEHVHHLFVVQSARRDALAEWLRQRGIQTQVHYPVPIHLQPPFRSRALRHPLPVTERLATEILSLPIYPEMSNEQIDWVVESVNAFGGH